MFSRAAKSFVQSFNQRSYHVSKTHFKNIPGKIENTSYNPTKFLQHTENAEPDVKKATLPFKNLKFQNLVNYGQGQNTLASAEGSPTGGKFPAVDISQIRGLGPIFSSASPVNQHKVQTAETGSGDHGDHARNDDYFPQGDEYEEEIGSEGFIRPDYNNHQPQQRSNRFPRVYEED